MSQVNMPKSPAGTKPHFSCDWLWKDVSCKTLGYADTGTPQCYGEVTRDVGLRPVSVAQCASKFGNPPQRVGYNFRCCK